MIPLRGLYAITPEGPQHDLLDLVNKALRGGTRLIQYRDKGPDPSRRLTLAKTLCELCRAAGVPFIFNDDPDLAAACGAHGVHLGRDDPDPAAARALLGPRAIIGVSCYNRLDLAHAAQAKGADYVAFGRFYPSGTKPLAVQANLDLLRQARRELQLPLVAIGGITPDNAQSLIAAGADLLAVVNGVFAAPDVSAAARAFDNLFVQSGD